MNIWKHCLLSQRKFGGQPQDYVSVHKFLDSSKLFYYHIRHRVALHNLFGIELCCELLGDFLQNSDGATVLVRDVAAEHCREDLSGVVPTLNDWLEKSDEAIRELITVPDTGDAEITTFLMRPYLRSGLHSSLLITCSNFGVWLVEKFFGSSKALILAECLPPRQTIHRLLLSFQYTERWQYTPDHRELQWLKEHEHGNNRHETAHPHSSE